MALHSLRVRRTLTTVSSLNRFLFSLSPPTNPMIPAFPPSSSSSLLKSPILTPQSSISIAQSGSLRWNQTSLYSSKPYKVYKEGDEITPDMVLFEGCDYNHWLITMDFPKDPQPTREEMIATYEQTCAKGLNISLEEAKKKIYACSTTTYQGFQAVMTEEESESFKDVPGVVFILPDSYIDPVNKEYGGDKYENGVITLRPPPVQYGGRGGPRTRDRNRNPDQPRYGYQGSQVPNRQGNPSYNQHGPMQGDGRNYGPPQNYPPQQNYGPPGQGERSPMAMNNRDYTPGGRDTYQADRRGPMPSYQGNPNQGRQGNYYAQEQRDFPPGNQVGDSPPVQRDLRDNRNYAPTHGGTYGQAANASYGQSYPGHGEGQRFSQEDQRNVQGEPRNYASMGQTGTDQRDFGDNRNYSPTHGGTYGQAANSSYGQSYPGHGEDQRLSQQDRWNVQGEPRNHTSVGQTRTDQSPVQRDFGDNRNYSPTHGGTYGQAANSSYGQSYPGHGEDQRLSQQDQWNVQGEPRNHTSVGQTRTDQGRY